MPASLKVLLEDVLDNLEDAEDGIVDEHGLTDPPTRELVLEHIDTALSRIDDALSQLADAGEPDTSQISFSLEAIARTCVNLAESALSDNTDLSPPEDEIGNCLKTIQYLIRMTPGGYLDLTRP